MNRKTNDNFVSGDPALPVHRRTDLCTGHGCWPPRPVVNQADVGHSPDVYVNNLEQVRNTDLYQPHCCGSCHTGRVADGSESVFTNNLESARQTDPITCGSRCDEHSPDVYHGD